MFQRVAILGVGLLGGSIGLAMKAAGMPARVIGYGHRRETLERALQMGAIDESQPELIAATRDADLVILCTPVGLFESLLKQTSASLKDAAVVTDVGSTKSTIVRVAEHTLPKNVHFIGSHPMAGSEKRGVEFARADLFQGARCILTPTAATDQNTTQRVDEFWQAVGMRTVRMSPQDHDRLVCDVSHLPHAVAAALVALQSDESLALAGKGFLDSTRIAGGDGAIWRDIFIDNRANLANSVQQLKSRLDHLLTMLEPGKRDDLRKWLDDVAARRTKLAADKLRELPE